MDTVAIVDTRAGTVVVAEAMAEVVIEASGASGRPLNLTAMMDMNSSSDLVQLTSGQTLPYRRVVLLTHSVLAVITGLAFGKFIDAHFTHSKSDALLTVGAPALIYVWSAAYSWNVMCLWRFVSNIPLRVGLYILVLVIGCAVTSLLITGVFGAIGGGMLFAACAIQAIVNFYAAALLFDVE